MAVNLSLGAFDSINLVKSLASGVNLFQYYGGKGICPSRFFINISL